jgi:hypothetical protein
LNVVHDLFAQRSASARDDLNYRLHRSLGSTGRRRFANNSKAPEGRGA